MEQALYERRPADNLIHHSDRGSQYLSIKYTERLADAGLEPSVGTVGCSYDNALAETMIGLFKAEVIHRFPMIPKLFTYGAGIGIQPFAVFQNTTQMDQLAPKAGDLIGSSAALAVYFATRDLPSATQLSHMLGVQTLEYDDPTQQAAAQHAKTQAAQSVLSGGDPLNAALTYRHQKEAASRKTKQHRLLRTPDEIIMTPPNKGYAFVDGLEHPVLFDRRPYYQEKWMTGRWMGNPYHPPEDRIRVKSWWGYRTIDVHEIPVSPEFANYPQYQSGRMRKLDL